MHSMSGFTLSRRAVVSREAKKQHLRARIQAYATTIDLVSNLHGWLV